MFNDVLFFMYIFAGFAGVLAIALAVLLIKYWSSGNKTLLASIRNFMICTALIDFFYFYMDYKELAGKDCSAGPVLRVLDIWLFIGQVYFWAKYLKEKSHNFDNLDKERISQTLILVCLAMSIVGYGFCMDGYYLAEPGIPRIFCIILELVLCISLSMINLWYLRDARHEVVQNKTRSYMTWVSALLVINGIWNAVILIILASGNLNFVIEKLIDPTPVFLLATNIFTVLLILSEDFAALFKAPESDSTVGNPEDDLKARLDYIAEAHLLTEREREVMEMAYHKMTNPEIAEKLCISKYTVKNHMHNIFEKLDIATRADLVMFVDKEES